LGIGYLIPILISHYSELLPMPTPAQIDEQIKLERQAIAQGLSKLRKNTRQLEERSYASASIYGIASIDTMLPNVIKEIEEDSIRGSKKVRMVLTLRRLHSIYLTLNH
jgi:hypothetical protein